MRRNTRDESLSGFLAINAMLREELRGLRRTLEKRSAETKYNPNWAKQPRAPRGVPTGGQWVDGGSKPQQLAYDTSKQSRPRRNTAESADEQRPPAFFDPIDDNPYFDLLSERGLLPPNPSVADFYNLRFQLFGTRNAEFIEIAREAEMAPSELARALEYGSSVMSERAIAAIETLVSKPGPGGLSIVIREERFQEYLANSGVRSEYRSRMYEEILNLAGYTPDEFEQHKLDIGVGIQFPFLVGGGGPAATPGLLPRATSALRNPNYVWNLGPATRGRIIEQALGHNLPANFRIIDRFGDDGIATSIKSVDLRAVTYHRTRTLERKLRGFINQVAGFNGARYAGREITARQIQGRALDLAIPSSGTSAQQQAISSAVAYGRSRGVTVNVIVYP
jgi:hypothetical protein